MREIEFRGKTTEGEWVYGNLGKHCVTREWFIQYDSVCNTVKTAFVFPKTVGQYTGLKDKNGVKIFEGDILKCEIGNDEVVEYKKSSFICIYRTISLYELWINQEIEIIGNIHDNKELVEK